MPDNIYGDKLSSGIDGHGVDIALQREDDLDKKAVEYIKTKPSPKVLDLGSGAGRQSLRMAQSGALVTAIDAHDFFKEFTGLHKANNLSLLGINYPAKNMLVGPQLNASNHLLAISRVFFLTNPLVNYFRRKYFHFQ